MTDTSALVAFVRARLDEDEQVARAATAGPWEVDDETYAEVIYADDRATSVVAGGRWGDEGPPFETTEDALHISRHDPARVLRDVAANRWILEQHVHYRFPPHPEGWLPQDFEATQPAFPGSDMPYVGCAICDWDSRYEQVDANTWCGYVRRLAAIWSDHPDYRQEWTP